MTGVLASRAQAARTLLFVPGDRPDRFDRALTSGAGLVVLDLEDAVVPQAKETAREAVSAALARGTTCAVRVNAAGTPWHEDDLAMLSRWPAVVMLPKVEDPASVEALVDRLGAERPVVALVESSRGILSAPRIAEAGVCRLALGTFDLAAEHVARPNRHIRLPTH